MNLALFYDTEITGLPLFSEPSEHPGQPHIVQLAACLADLDTQQTIASMDVIIRPNGWTIPDEVAAVHGITTEHAAAVGIEEKTALDMFMALHSTCGFRVAHNEQFDARIVRIALKRFFDAPGSELPESDIWKSGQSECTARLSRPICALPKSKVPTMAEAYRNFTGKELENSHRAMADVQACMAVYFAIKNGEK